jgi:hypothetical protein
MSLPGALINRTYVYVGFLYDLRGLLRTGRELERGAAEDVVL